MSPQAKEHPVFGMLQRELAEHGILTRITTRTETHEIDGRHQQIKRHVLFIPLTHQTIERTKANTEMWKNLKSRVQQPEGPDAEILERHVDGINLLVGKGLLPNKEEQAQVESAPEPTRQKKGFFASIATLFGVREKPEPQKEPTQQVEKEDPIDRKATSREARAAENLRRWLSDLKSRGALQEELYVTADGPHWFASEETEDPVTGQKVIAPRQRPTTLTIFKMHR